MTNNIRSIRESLGISLSGLAARVRMSPQSLSRAEAGRHGLSEDLVRRLSEVLEVRPSQILPGEVVDAVREEIRVRHELVLREAAYWDADLRPSDLRKPGSL